MKPLIFQIVDTGVFVLLVISLYFAGIVLGRSNMRLLGSGSLFRMLKWLTTGLFFGMLFQAYIFIFDYKKVGGFSAADVSVGWHFFFVMTILFMLIGMVQVLRK